MVVAIFISFNISSIKTCLLLPFQNPDINLAFCSFGVSKSIAVRVLKLGLLLGDDVYIIWFFFLKLLFL